MRQERKPVLLRFDPAVHDALARWAADEFRSLNAQVELLLRRALTDAGRMPRHAAALPRRGRPRTSREPPTGGTHDDDDDTTSPRHRDDDERAPADSGQPAP